jgi:hypothetical protein
MICPVFSCRRPGRLPFGLSFIVTRPSSIRRRLISLTRVGERPRASCCVEAEGPNDRRNSS